MTERTNLTIDVEDADELPPASGRRLLRWATVLVAIIAAVSHA